MGSGSVPLPRICEGTNSFQPSRDGGMLTRFLIAEILDNDAVNHWFNQVRGTWPTEQPTSKQWVHEMINHRELMRNLGNMVTLHEYDIDKTIEEWTDQLKQEGRFERDKDRNVPTRDLRDGFEGRVLWD